MNVFDGQKTVTRQEVVDVSCIFYKQLLNEVELICWIIIAEALKRFVISYENRIQ